MTTKRLSEASLLDFLPSDRGDSTKKISSLSSRNGSELPVNVKSIDWNVYTEPERFHKIFEFQSTQSLIFFVSEILKFESEIQHSGKITIEESNVAVEIWTRDLDKITAADQDYIDTVDLIYQDSTDSGIIDLET